MDKTLDKAKIGVKYSIAAIDIDDKKLGLRLMELGFFVGNIIVVEQFSARKKTMLVALFGCIYAFKSSIAKYIVISELQ